MNTMIFMWTCIMSSVILIHAQGQLMIDILKDTPMHRIGDKKIKECIKGCNVDARMVRHRNGNRKYLEDMLNVFLGKKIPVDSSIHNYEVPEVIQGDLNGQLRSMNGKYRSKLSGG